MASKDVYEIELTWQFMAPMEQSVWATTLALRALEADGGVSAADAGVLRLRSLGVTRAHRPEPEHEVARSNVYIEFDEFAGWYPVAYRLMHGKERGYQEPNDEQVKNAYEAYARSRTDYY